MGFVSIVIKVANACLIYNIDFVIHVFFYKNHKCLINQDISQVRVKVWMQQMALNPKHTHTHTHKRFPWDVSIIPHGLHCTPPSVPHIPTPHPLLTLLGVAMALPQLLWYPGYGDTLWILIGCQQWKGGHTQKRKGRKRREEKKGKEGDPGS